MLQEALATPLQQSQAQAVAQVGKSPAGEVAHLVVPTLVPGVPVSLSVSKITRTGFHLSWLPPKADGGSPLTQYSVDLKPVTRAAVKQGVPEEWSRIHCSQVRQPR